MAKKKKEAAPSADELLFAARAKTEMSEEFLYLAIMYRGTVLSCAEDYIEARDAEAELRDLFNRVGTVDP